MGIAQFDSRRKLYFEGTGIEMPSRIDTKTALELSGLNYEVVKEPLFLSDSTLVENNFCTVKTDDRKQLGIVGKNYGIVQNFEAFDFLDEVLVEGEGQGARIETAGHFNDFSKSFIVASTDALKILDDDFKPYMLFTNSFDGSGSVRVIFTPVRVFCSNAIKAAIKKALQVISIRHSNNVMDRLQIAKGTLQANNTYLQSLQEEAEFFATQRLTPAQFKDSVIPLILKELKLDNEDRKRGTDRVERIEQDILTAYNQRDLQNYNGTAYKAIQAISDFESHYEPFRNTNNPHLYMQRIMGGMVLLTAVLQTLSARFGYKA